MRESSTFSTDSVTRRDFAGTRARTTRGRLESRRVPARRAANARGATVVDAIACNWETLSSRAHEELARLSFEANAGAFSARYFNRM